MFKLTLTSASTLARFPGKDMDTFLISIAARSGDMSDTVCSIEEKTSPTGLISISIPCVAIVLK
ncbi:hypothetical protein thsrh120_54960 [Rhizobium sp. No.120]